MTVLNKDGQYASSTEEESNEDSDVDNNTFYPVDRILSTGINTNADRRLSALKKGTGDQKMMGGLGSVLLKQITMANQQVQQQKSMSKVLTIHGEIQEAKAK